MKSDLIKKKYWRIGEVADKLNVTTSLLRFYEVYFGLLILRYKSRNTRRYTEQDVEDMAVIYKLTKVDGYTLKAAKREFLNYKQNNNDIKGDGTNND